MNLKIGGSNVGKIMYNGQEFGNRKLEPGTILYMSKTTEDSFENVHLLSTTRNWSNINGINIKIYSNDNFVSSYGDVNITSDDFKSLNEAKTYKIGTLGIKVTASISIVDGEYRLNVSGSGNSYSVYRFLIKAI